MVQPLWKTVWRYLRKLKIELPYDPAIPLLGIYLVKITIQKDTYSCNVHSSTIYNSQDIETTSMSINRGMGKEDVVYICNGILLSLKKNEIMSFAATWMDLEMIILSQTNII